MENPPGTAHPSPHCQSCNVEFYLYETIVFLYLFNDFQGNKKTPQTKPTKPSGLVTLLLAQTKLLMGKKSIIQSIQ